METVGNTFQRVNHADFWKVVRNVVSGGLDDIVSGDAKDRRTDQKIGSVAFLTKRLIYLYENPTTTKGIMSMPKLPGGYQPPSVKYTSRENLAEMKNTEGQTEFYAFGSAIPKEMLTTALINGKEYLMPIDAAYIWAKMRYAIDFENADPKTVAAKYGISTPLEKIDYGKLDWNAILKKALVIVGTLVGAVATGGIGGILAVGASSKALDAVEQQRINDLQNKLGLTSAKAASIAQTEIMAQREADLQAAADRIGFLSFENPYFIMIAMTIATIILFIVFKHKKQ